jgi:beta-lactamase class A
MWRYLFLFSFLASRAWGQNDLREQIREIAADAQGKVSVACSLPGSNLNCDLNADAHPPMQSVFKFPLALATLHLVETGTLSLDQSVRFLPTDRIPPSVYSPLQSKYPQANVDISLRELLRLTVSLSDNTAADVLLRVIGGPRVVEAYMISLGIEGFHIESTERELHFDIASQYRNWFEPRAAVQLLRRFNDNSLLTAPHTALIKEWMCDTPTTPHRLKGGLPAGTVVLHKSGTSDTNQGLTYATNDIGLIVLPDGQSLAIAVFVTDSRAEDATRDAVIARIAKAAYDAALKLSK